MRSNNGVTLKPLITKVEIKSRIDQLVDEIGTEFRGKDLVVVGLLTGSFIFLADLVRGFNQRDIRPQIDFMIVSSYRGTKSSGKVRVIQDIKTTIKERWVLLVDDILDTGRTLSFVTKYLLEKGPSVLKTCVFLDKKGRRDVLFEADHIGFEIPDVFVVGYGLDYDSRYRELPFIAQLHKTS